MGKEYKVNDLYATASAFNRSDIATKVKNIDSFFAPIKKKEKTKVIEDGIEKEIEVEVETDKVLYFDTLEKIEEIAHALLNDGYNSRTKRFMDSSDIMKELRETSAPLKDYGVGSTGYLTQTIITRAVELIQQDDYIYTLFSDTIPFKTNMQIVSPKFIDTSNGALDVGPNGNYHVLTVDEDFEQVTTTGASGIDVLLSETAMKNSHWPLLKIFLQAAKNALGRWKDTKAIRTLVNNAVVCFDNLGDSIGGADSMFGHTTGISLATKSYNKAFVMDDFWKMFNKAIKDGFMPDTIITSVEGYEIFMRDPLIKKFIENQTGVVFKLPTNLTAAPTDMVSAMNGTGMARQKPKFDIPGGLFGPSKAFTLIVTPFIPAYESGDIVYQTLLDSKNAKVPYKDVAGDNVVCGKTPITSLVLLDSKNALYLCEEEKLRVLQKTDEFDELTKVRLKEKYSFVPKHKGRGVYVAKNIFLADDTVDIKRDVVVDLATASDIISKL